MLIAISINVEAVEGKNFNNFATQYFEKVVATQMPNATEQDLDDYLALLKDDVGHSHPLWVIDDGDISMERKR